MAYDIIGDIHGQADKLHGLLAHLGYRATGGTYRHPTRSAIFVGDFIDRGDKQLSSLNTVRRMADAGSALAVMGNHEFNAIAWHTPDPAQPGDFCRTRMGALGVKNREQHEAFLREVERDPKLHNEWVNWFLTLPLWLDLPSIRIEEAAKRARTTATMANTLCKALAKRYGQRWQFVDFLGPNKAESAGVIDLIAIRKDGRPPTLPGVKPLDLFEMILIQVKGGSARSPTDEDVDRMRVVGKRYAAEKLVLFEWSKEKHTGWSMLSNEGTWVESTAAKIFGKQS